MVSKMTLTAGWAFGTVTGGEDVGRSQEEGKRLTSALSDAQWTPRPVRSVVNIQNVQRSTFNVQRFRQPFDGASRAPTNYSDCA
jgi:hypothetical protein